MGDVYILFFTELNDDLINVFISIKYNPISCV